MPFIPEDQQSVEGNELRPYQDAVQANKFIIIEVYIEIYIDSCDLLLRLWACEKKTTIVSI